MTLPFSQTLNGKPTFFVEKVLKNFHKIDLLDHFSKNDKLFSLYKYNKEVYDRCAPKIHTIREDLSDRWQEGKMIHPIINNRTKRQVQFAPNFPCVSTQKIEIIYAAEAYTVVKVDGEVLFGGDKERFAVNDGFSDFGEFNETFRALHPSGFSGKIIHFTKFRY
jgi:hypothetical protein